MNRYCYIMPEAEVREALRSYVQNEVYPNTTVGNVVYFSHDLTTGSMAVEFSHPLPPEDDEYSPERYK